MPSEPIPKFDGKASTFATFIMEFVGYAILQIDGVKYLHALEQNHDPNSWYTMKAHVGTGTNYHYEDTEELSAIYEEQVDAATCPAYPLATTQAERKEARAKDKLARRLLAAALRNACKASSTAAARMQKSDPMDGVSGLLVSRAKYANTTVSVNRSVSLRQAMWSEDWGTGTISQFLERVEARINDCIDNGVAVTETDKYGASAELMTRERR